MAKKTSEATTASKLGDSDDGGAMTAERFRTWRKRLGLKQKEAADRLGLKKRMIQYYEKGDRDGKPVTIPKTVRLACHALSDGVVDFDGETAERAAPAAEASVSEAPAS